MENMETNLQTETAATTPESVAAELKEAGKETTENKPAEEGNEKLFTQEEVNGFVQSRVAREKAGIEKRFAAEYAAKEQELVQREMRLYAKEQIADMGLPRELADIVSGTTQEEIKAKLDILSKHYKKDEPVAESSGFRTANSVRIGAPRTESTISNGMAEEERIRKAMGIR